MIAMPHDRPSPAPQDESQQRLRGVYAILMTPFTERDTVDDGALQRQIRFCREAGADGVVGPALFSEVQALSDNERKRFLEVAAQTARGERHLPFVAACSGGSAAHAVELARHAQVAGAAAVMLMPPSAAQMSLEDTSEYFQRVADAVDVPIILQNPPPAWGRPLPASAVLQLVETIPRIEYVKEEAAPEHHRISALIAAAGSQLKGVFGGLGGLHMLAELRRGAVGNMPAAECVDIHAQIYRAFRAGAEVRAEELMRRLLPAVVLEGLLGPQFSKEVLRRRGVLSGTAVRPPQARMDAADQEELDRLWPDLEQLFSWRQ